MKLKHYIITLVMVGIGILLPACKSGDGPLLINTSGQSVRLVVHLADGSTYDGECGDQAAVWAGRAKAVVSEVEIFMGETKFDLKGDELAVPYGKDATTAFIIESTGPRKLALDEAKILMRGK